MLMQPADQPVSSCLLVLHGKNFKVGQYMQSFQPDFVIPSMLIDTSDIYYFIPLSVTLTLAGGHKISRE